MYRTLSPFVAAVFAAHAAVAGQFVVELDAPLVAPDLMASHGVSLDESLAAGVDSYAVFTASDSDALADFFAEASVHPEKAMEVLFVNSPAVGGGKPRVGRASPRPPGLRHRASDPGRRFLRP